MKDRFCSMLFVLVMLFPVVSQSRTYEGIEFPDTVSQQGAGQDLVLNGIGMRTKFVFDVYIGALYTESHVSSRAEVLALSGPKRIVMHFVYDEVTAEKLVAAWNEGFEDNNSEQQLATLKQRIEQFNALFNTVHAGDVVLLDYVPDKGTVVTIKGEQKGVIEGRDFNNALLDIWLGDDPADSELKEAMLGMPD